MSTAAKGLLATTLHDPAAEYCRRLAARAATVRRAARWNRRITVGRRLLLFSVIGYVVFDPTEAQALIPLGIALVPLLFLQNAVLRVWRRASKAVTYYENGLARLENRWIGRGPDGHRYLSDSHLYAEDLDIFGSGSLFQLLCTAQTRMGQDTLAAWLAAPAELSLLRPRQQLVRALAGNLDLREALAALDADLGQVVPQGLLRWADAAPILPTVFSRAVGVALVWGGTISLLAGLVTGGGWWLVFGGCCLGEALFYLARRSAAGAVARHVGDAGFTLDVLYRLHAALRRTADVPDALIAHDATIERALTMPLGWMPRIYGLFLQNSFLHALKVQGMPPWEIWRLRAQPAIPSALAAAGEIEALAALSAYAYERPGDPYPELVAEGPRFAGEGLMHPLMAPGKCVPNDVTLGGERRLILVSGSNMSGKSTLMRTVGTNIALALAGAPVRATRLTLSPLVLGTAMRFRDNVHEGASYFYAVLKRLRAVLDVLDQERPLLFLFDEILQGTNSQDRLIGAEALMRKLVDAGALGIMTTHDLALTKIVDDLAPRAVNMHCEDQVHDGQMTFDYKLRPGVVTKSNALVLMRAMGLDV